MKNFLKLSISISCILGIVASCIHISEASYHFDSFKASPPIHLLGKATPLPHGFTPDDIKKIYNLPKTGGSGTIAIIAAYDDPTIEKDLNTFSSSFNIPSCTIQNKCFEKHILSAPTKTNSGWSMETSLDVEWAHAIAPQAKILLIETPTPSGINLLKAIDYARSRNDVVAISMSWGGTEFPEETTLDSHFISKYGAQFFAASGDSGAGVSWPAVSPYVIAVGGTSIHMNSPQNFTETAWSGSGGGVSAYEPQPAYQATYNIPRAHGMRAIPDVSYNADPSSGYAIFRSTPTAQGAWYVVGGTSASTPQWAALYALGHSVSLSSLYADKKSDHPENYFRDIMSGSNGSCTYYCQARARYDYVTGLGSPVTTNF